MNDGRAALGNIRVIEGDCPGFGHRLRMMGTATEHIRRGHNKGLLFAGSEKARVEVGQQRALASSGLHRLVPVGETLRPDPTHALIARRSSSTAATKSKRDPARSALATNA